MDHSPKEVQCQCGNLVVVDKKRIWCTKCGKPVYREEKQQRLHKINNTYMMGMIIVVICFVAFLFIEMIVIPIFRVSMP